MKKLFKCLTYTLIAGMLFSMTAYADVISDTPVNAGTEQETTAPAKTGPTSSLSEAAPEQQAVTPGTVLTLQEETTAASENVTRVQSETQAPVQSDAVQSNVPVPIVPGSTTGAGPGAGSVNTIAAPAGSENSGTSVSSGGPGSDYGNAAMSRVELGFTVISPNFDYNGYKVAEGMVQLKDGSWETIEHGKYIRQPYFRFLREEGDWYVAAVHGNRIGNYTTSDGSVVSELWLKKSECIARNYIELNTANPTRQNIVRYALMTLGNGYKYAANGPDFYDCSGLVNAVVTSSGINIARNSYEICNAGTQVGISGLRPGDIVGRPGHVGVYIGNGYFVHAAETSSGVVSDSVEIYNRSSAFSSYRNIVGD